MARDDGFKVADVASDLLDDVKVRKLWRCVGRDKAAMTEAVTIHVSVILGSWSAGRRVTVDEAAPVWLDVDPAQVTALVDCGLLDVDNMLPVAAWRKWYGPASERRDARRVAGRAGGLARAEQAFSNALATAEQPLSDAIATPNPTVLPSVRPTDIPSVIAREATNGERPSGAPARKVRNTVDDSPFFREVREAQETRYAAEDAKPTIEPLPTKR